MGGFIVKARLVVITIVIILLCCLSSISLAEESLTIDIVSKGAYIYGIGDTSWVEFYGNITVTGGTAPYYYNTEGLFLYSDNRWKSIEWEKDVFSNKRDQIPFSYEIHRYAETATKFKVKIKLQDSNNIIVESVSDEIPIIKAIEIPMDVDEYTLTRGQKAFMQINNLIDIKSSDDSVFATRVLSNNTMFARIFADDLGTAILKIQMLDEIVETKEITIHVIDEPTNPDMSE